ARVRRGILVLSLPVVKLIFQNEVKRWAVHPYFLSKGIGGDKLRDEVRFLVLLSQEPQLLDRNKAFGWWSSFGFHVPLLRGMAIVKIDGLIWIAIVVSALPCFPYAPRVVLVPRERRLIDPRERRPCVDRGRVDRRLW